MLWEHFVVPVWEFCSKTKGKKLQYDHWSKNQLAYENRFPSEANSKSREAKINKALISTAEVFCLQLCWKL